MWKRPCGVILAIVLAACAQRGPIMNAGDKIAAVSGTISGVVRASGSNAPLTGRKVTATDVSSGAKFDVTTAANGGYTIKVPLGKYRVEVELRQGESLAEAPADLEINTSDLDAGRDFLIASRPAPG